MLDFEPAAREVIRLSRGVTDDQLSGPTPCDGMSVAALLDHLMGLSLAFTSAARKSVGSGAGAPTAPGAESLDPRWREILPGRLDEMVEAWRDPAAWEGEAAIAGLTLPAGAAGAAALDELVLHGWDLARATGQPFSCDPASTEAVLAFTTAASRPENAPNRSGLFGPVVAVPQDAPPFDRALGLSGRDPAWTPETS